MKYLLATVTLNHVSTVNRDADQWGFPIRADVASALDAANALDTSTAFTRLFDTTDSPTTHPLAYYLGPSIIRGGSTAHTIDYYDISTHLDGSSHGSPVKTTRFGIATAAHDSIELPAQDSCVVSLHGQGWSTAAVESGGTRPRQRHAGRLYVGPLGISVMGEVGSEGRFVNPFFSDIIYSFNQFMGDVLSISGDFAWGVWSRANAAMYDVAEGYVDNSPDVQRRRKVAATLRTDTFPF